MHSTNPPDLTAIVPVRDELAKVHTTIAHLRSQTVAKQIELVIVGPSDAFRDVTPSQFTEFRACQFVEVDAVTSSGAAYALGIQRAKAPVVACCEDHAFPDPGWAQALIEAHRQPWAVVGPAMRNGNPETTVSWASFFMSFGPWAAPATSTTVTHLSWNNNSYKRDVMLAYGSKLEAMLDAESVLHWDLISKGHRLYLEAAAQTDHLNVAQLIPWLRFEYHAGRKFAASRCRNWSWLKRLFYCSASPLIPFLRFYRSQKDVRRPGRCPDRMLAVLCVLMMGLIVDGLGQALGYVTGIGGSSEKCAEFDLNRMKYL